MSICNLNESEWELKLLIDNREIESKAYRAGFTTGLSLANVSHEFRSLAVGDALWIVRRRNNPTTSFLNVSGTAISNPDASIAVGMEKVSALQSSQTFNATDVEFPLKYIIERKKIDDLASSVIDGRFHEQKLRLSSTQMSITYLIEGSLAKYDPKYSNISSKHLRGAVVNTLIQSGFRVSFTSSFQETLNWFVQMHYLLKNDIFKSTSKTLRLDDNFNTLRNVPHMPVVVITYAQLYESGKRHRVITALEAFGGMLRQVYGCSESKAQALMEGGYKTVKQLTLAVQKDQGNGKNKKRKSFVANLEVPNQSQKVGPVLADRITSIFGFE
jgi:ERCC4-type nuclease